VLEVLVGLVLAGIVSAVAGRLWFRVAIFTPVMLPMVVVARAVVVRLQPRLRAGERGAGRRGPRAAPAGLAGRPGNRAGRGLGRVGWVYAGFYMMIFYAAFRQVRKRGVEAAAPRRGRRVGAVPPGQGADDPLRGLGRGAALRHRRLPRLRLFFVLTNGGPYGATEIPTTLLVKTGVPQRRRRLRVVDGRHLTLIVLGVGCLLAALRQGKRARRSGGRDTGDVLSTAPPSSSASCPGAGADDVAPPSRRGCSSAPRCLLLALVFFFPLIWMVMSSFKTNSAIFSAPFSPPDSIDFSKWAEAWTVGNLGQYAINSAIVTIASVVLILLLGAAAGLRAQPLPFPRPGPRPGPVCAGA
jgi:ABC-type sugar transport system permease subunit